MVKKSLIFIGTLFIIIGLVFIFIVPSDNITGKVVGRYNSIPILSSIFGYVFLIFGFSLLATATRLEKIVLSSSIKKHPSILKLTQKAVRDQTVERELNHLVEELEKGNFEAGLGHPGHIGSTDIFYLRGRNGGRLYYHKIGENNYEVVAKSSKGRNQDQVINKLREIYER